MSKHNSWSIITFGLIIMACGSLVLMVLISYWEESIKKRLEIDFQNITEKTASGENKVMALSAITDMLQNKVEPLLSTHHHEHIKIIKELEDSLKENQQKQAELKDEVEFIKTDLIKSEEEKKILADQLQEIDTHFADLKLQSFQDINEKNNLLSALQKTIEEQKADAEKKDLQIQQLDAKIRDLNYEIKTLLYLHDTEKENSNVLTNTKYEEPIKVSYPKSSFNPYSEMELPKTETLLEDSEDVIKTSTEASILLKKYILIAQKQSSINYYENETSRYWDMTTPHFTIDQRRLFDALKDEMRGLILVYSPRESKIVFVNHLSIQWLGWSPEKFIQDFSLIIQDGMQEWKRSLSLLNSSAETQSRLLVKSKQGHEKVMYCHLGSISTGSFKNYVLGVLYPA